ncbi:hypothetical protein [Lysobacter sp. CA196]|uniref:hypothetical protein n=1 Tax=Lysobacter sp. CA196 TaxID=3455606 RepID=UPI003F8D1669
MPDRTPSAPQDWSSAFAQLPPETPPADGWSRIAATLAQRGVLPAPSGSSECEPVRPRSIKSGAVQIEPRRATLRARPRQRWMMAAMLAAALPLGLWLSQRSQNPSEAGAVTDAVAPTDAAPAIASPTTGAGLDPPRGTTPHAPQVAAAPHRNASSQDTPATAVAAVPTPKSARDGLASTPAATPRRAQRSPTRLAARDRGETANAPATAAQIPPVPTDTALIASADADARLLRELGELQAESAQLETLIALTRDEQVGSATATVMSSELDERVRLIDATLIAGSLPAAQRLSLWQQRVGALRTLAGVESTQRWFAARGERYDDALVRVD